MRDETGASAEARRHLSLLRAELARQGLESELVTSGFWPRLRLRLPGAFGDVWDDNVVAAELDGAWQFFWPWVEPIGRTDDPVAAAGSVLVAVCLDVCGGCDE
jgi:hypothetical protein